MRILAGAFALVVTAATTQSAFAQARATSVAPVATPAAAATVSILQKVCLPLLQGGDLKKIGPAAGLQDRDGQWVLPIENRTRIELDPPDIANPHVCMATITYRPGANAVISAAVNAWTKSQTPPLQPVKIQQTSTSSTYLYTTSLWTARTPTGNESIVLSGKKTLLGQPILGDLGQTTLLVSLNPA